MSILAQVCRINTYHRYILRIDILRQTAFASPPRCINMGRMDDVILYIPLILLSQQNARRLFRTFKGTFCEPIFRLSQDDLSTYENDQRNYTFDLT